MAPLQLPRPGNAYGAGPLGGAEGAEGRAPAVPGVLGQGLPGFAPPSCSPL